MNVHVVLIHACNMKENALASCISYARSHRVKSGVGVGVGVGVGAGYGLFTSVGEWVVNLGKSGTKSKVEIHECVK